MDKNSAFAIMHEAFSAISITKQFNTTIKDDPFVKEADADVEKLMDIVEEKLGRDFYNRLSDAISGNVAAYHDVGVLNGMQTMQALLMMCKEPVEFRNYVKSQVGGGAA